jgi:hypothetical protein
MKKPRYKSKFEAAVAAVLPRGTQYEPHTFPYTLELEYTPDWRIPTTSRLAPPVYIETTGKFDYEKRRKLAAVKRAHPGLDLRILFQRNNKLSRKSKMTNMEWAAKHGFRASVFPQLPLDPKETRRANRKV